jgi:hypothetical protein
MSAGRVKSKTDFSTQLSCQLGQRGRRNGLFNEFSRQRQLGTHISADLRGADHAFWPCGHLFAGGSRRRYVVSGLEYLAVGGPFRKLALQTGMEQSQRRLFFFCNLSGNWQRVVKGFSLEPLAASWFLSLCAVAVATGHGAPGSLSHSQPHGWRCA